MTNNPNPRPRFQISGRIGFIAMCIWFILTGAIVLLHLSMESLPAIMGILAIAAGILMLVGVLHEP